MTPQQVSVVVNSGSFQYELAQRRDKLDDMTDESIVASADEVTKAIRSHTLNAAQRLGLMVAPGSDSKDADAIRAASEILDRGGHPKVHSIESKNFSVVIDAEMVKRIEDAIAMDRDGGE
jgi:hypothetical protein